MTSAPNSKSSIVASPSLSSASSFDMLSSLSRTNTTVSQDAVSVVSDDEIVWNVPEDSWSDSSDHSHNTENSVAASDDDFVVLSWARRPGIPTSRQPNRHISNSGDLSSRFQSLSLGGQPPESTPVRKAKAGKRKKGKKSKSVAQPSLPATKTSYPSPVATPTPDKQALSTTRTTTSKKCKRKKRATPGLGSRPIVDDMSERTSEAGDDAPNSIYEDAGRYITTFLTNPASRDRESRLTLLQALIIELGLCASPSASTLPALPGSLKAAKALIKSSAFLNIREYIAVRHQGPTALQRVMYPSRSSLIKDIRKNRSATSLKWVKEHGLQVLLVSPYH